jgi:hypothetical protein
MKKRKTHIKLKGRPVCGTTAEAPKFARAKAEATCLNCQRAVEK